MIRKRIIWLDNDVNYLVPYVETLKEEGFEVTVVRTVGEADFRLTKLPDGAYHLLLLDVMIPTKNAEEEANFSSEETDHGYQTGLVFYRKRKTKLREEGTKVLVLTVRLDDASYKDFVAEGLPSDCYATKYTLRAVPDFLRRVKTLIGASA